MASAICLNCHILLVEAASESISDLGTAVNEAATLGANAISNSYRGHALAARLRAANDGSSSCVNPVRSCTYVRLRTDRASGQCGNSGDAPSLTRHSSLAERLQPPQVWALDRLSGGAKAGGHGPELVSYDSPLAVDAQSLRSERFDDWGIAVDGIGALNASIGGPHASWQTNLGKALRSDWPNQS
jgi:hypothetical protein